MKPYMPPETIGLDRLITEEDSVKLFDAYSAIYGQEDAVPAFYIFHVLDTETATGEVKDDLLKYCSFFHRALVINLTGWKRACSYHNEAVLKLHGKIPGLSPGSTASTPSGKIIPFATR